MTVFPDKEKKEANVKMPKIAEDAWEMELTIGLPESLH